MEKGIITLENVLKAMERRNDRGEPVAFSITFVQADRHRRTGGKVVTYHFARLAKNAKQATAAQKTGTPGAKRLQKHWQNATRNLLLQNGEIRKIHIRLIVKFNDQPVIW